MKDTFLFIFFLIFAENSGFSQSDIYQSSKFEEYDQLVYHARIQYADKNFKDAHFNFNLAFKIIDDDSSDDYFLAASAALKLAHYKEAERLIVEGITKTNAPKEYFLRFEEFNSYREMKFFKDIELNFSKYQEEFLTKVNNLQIYNEVQLLFKSDQEVRITGGDLQATDHKNITRFIEITKKHGWQKEGWILLWHHRDSYLENNFVWSYFKPFIDNQIKEGNIRKSFWARYEDDAMIEKEQVQIYGLYWSQYDEFPIRDIENVDNRRRSIGLPPIWYMNKVYGLPLPKSYKGTPLNSSLSN